MDIIEDIIARIVATVPEASKLGREELDAIERDIRRDWGGERPYIAKTGQVYQQVMSARNRAILRDWYAGERQQALARKWGISRQRVSQIVKEGIASRLP